VSLTAPPMDPSIARSLDTLARRERFAAESAVHRAAGPAVDPDPSYQPRHLRRNHDA